METAAPIQWAAPKANDKRYDVIKSHDPPGTDSCPDRGHKGHNMKDGNNSEEGLQILYDSPRTHRSIEFMQTLGR